VNLNGWVLEASAALDSIGRAELERVGLTRDLPEHQARLFVGQFSAPSSAFSNGAGPLNGIALASRTGFEPQVRRKTPESINLRLESPAELVFNVNDERARSLELASGLYSVYGLPLRSGINRVRVEDSEGAETYFEGFVPFDRRFLAPGERDFASFIGFPDGRPEVVGLGFFAEYGITDSLLLSIDNQSSLDGLLVELSTLLGTRFGILNVGSGYSYLRDADPALSGRLAYTFSPEWVPGVSAGLGFGVDQSGFGSPFRASAADESRYSVNAGLTFALPLGFGLQVSGGHRAPLGSIEGSTTLVATLSRTFDRSLQLRLSSSLRTSPEDEPAISLRVSIRETGSERPYDLSTKYSVDEGTASAGLRGRIDRALSTTYYSVDIDGLPVSPAEEPLGLSAQVSHRRSRFDLSGRHSVSEPLLEGGRRGYTGRFEASTALLFADGAFAIGPSIRDSFALIASGESLDGARVILGDRGESRPSASGALGAAIATSLQSYEYNRIDVDVPEAPVTANLGRLSYTLVPTYRSGTLITVDAAPDITLGFRITDRNGNPIPLHAGELAAVEGGRHAPFFSDEAGFVEVYGLDPGNYRALLYDGRRAAEPIRVGPGDSGEVNLGSIQMITEEAE
jgi:outer membrane usher protein